MGIFKVFQEAVIAEQDGRRDRATLVVVRNPGGLHATIYANDDRYIAMHKNRTPPVWHLWEAADEQFLHYVAVLFDGAPHIEFVRPDLWAAGLAPASPELIAHGLSHVLRNAATGGRPN